MFKYQIRFPIMRGPKFMNGGIAVLVEVLLVALVLGQGVDQVGVR